MAHFGIWDYILYIVVIYIVTVLIEHLLKLKTVTKLNSTEMHFPRSAAQISRKDKIRNEIKAVPLQAWSGPEGSRKLRPPDFVTKAQDVGKVVVSITYRPLLPPGNTPGTHFC